MRSVSGGLFVSLPERGWIIFTAILVAVTAAGGVVYWSSLVPVCCDAVSYGQLAASYQTEGLLAVHAGAKLRTYLYPAFLALVQTPQQLSGVKAGAHDPTVAAWQAVFFLGSVLSLFLATRRFGSAVQVSVIIGLAFNIFILVFIPIRLTEILSLCCFIILATVTIELACGGSTLRRGSVLLFLLGSFVAGIAIMVRPANVALAMCWFMFGILYLWCLASAKGRLGGSLKLIALGSAGLLVFMVPLAPQWIINITLFGRGTIFPVDDLGSQQLAWGITHLKYTTLITDVGAKGFIYPNPFLVNEGKYLANPLGFYMEHPFQGLKTVLLHIFNSITFDYLHPYVSDVRPWYMPVTLALNHFLVFAGVAAGGYLISRRIGYVWQGGIRLKIEDTWWLFLCFTAAALCALNAVVAVESRFGLPIIAVLGPLACYGVLVLVRRASARSKMILAVGAVAYILAAEALSFWILGHGLAKLGGS